MLYGIQQIEKIKYDDQDNCFYLLANQRNTKLGIYMLQIDEFDPSSYNYMIKWNTKLKLSDANIYIQRNEERGVKELIVSFKQIYVNTKNLIVFDLSENQVSQDYEGKTQGRNIVIMHESFQLWQKSVETILIDDTNCMIILTQDGISTICLSDYDKRVVVDEQNNQFIMHSLESFNYLKVDKGNFL